MRKADVFLVSTHCTTAVCQMRGMGTQLSWWGQGAQPFTCTEGTTHVSQLRSHGACESEGQAWETVSLWNSDLGRVGKGGKSNSGCWLGEQDLLNLEPFILASSEFYSIFEADPTHFLAGH